MFATRASTLYFCTEENLLCVKLSFDGNQLNSVVSKHRLEEFCCSTVVYLCVSAEHYICLIDHDKKIFLIKQTGDSIEIIAHSKLPRLPSCATFSPDESYVVACDKQGNVYKLRTSSFPGDDYDADHPQPVIGHFSMLSDIVISDDCKLIATCDRDEKIRISRFDHPFVIHAFCLGHTSYVTRLAFVPGSRILLSAGGDGFLRLWNSSNGKELSDYPLDFSDEEDSDESPVIVSHLFIVHSNICVGCSSSHPVLFSLPFTDKAPFYWGEISHVDTPMGLPLVDIASISNVPNQPTGSFIIVGLTMFDSPRLVAWLLTRIPSDDNSVGFAMQWHEIFIVDFLAGEVLSFPEQNPRLSLLKDLHKSASDHSLVETYEKNKSHRHQVIAERRARHAKKRKMRQASGNEEAVQ